MLKYLMLAGIIYAIYIVFFKKKELLNSKKTKDKENSETMVECHECQAYVSINEAYLVDGKYFCSKECVDAYNRS